MHGLIANTGNSGIYHKIMFENIPVGYPAGTKIKKFNIEFETAYTLSDGDMKVFQAVLKIFTDNSFEVMQELAKMDIQDARAIDFFDMKIPAREITKQARFTNRSASRRLDAIKRLSGFTITLRDDEGNMTGFLSLVRNSGELSKSGKNIEIGINTRFLIALAKDKIQYDFKKMMSFDGLEHRLYSVIQSCKHQITRGKYGYHAIKHQALLDGLNLENTSEARTKIRRTFEAVGVKFILHRSNQGDFWDYNRE